MSSFGHRLNNNLLNLPKDKPFPGLIEPKPYYFVGDEAFPLQMNLMRPFGGKMLSTEQRIYNYRLSRARRLIENTFGIMVARFRIFHTTIFKKPENVDGIVKACVCLHNYIKKAEQDTLVKRYCGSSFADADVNETLIPGEWRNEAPSQSALRSITESKRELGLEIIFKMLLLIGIT